ncbi:phosphate signaling complex protein PhoU [Tautonia plasticadhaerens]|uniref:Phosphate-specific transport system accessory protein PhoU n=1 Tax=Tautonia plasticadhaerens TaxID=2527974 RepID=A0A518H9V7_9BACT|nr:phosphate signaling complex protein PhoU [Tautonia plasticadhaerens]QDV37630.1 hypothetical protein ElP_55710 [Tautonia plasticadhaerens]
MRAFEQELERITASLLRLAALAEERVADAIRSLCDRSPDLADAVIRGDEVIDWLEVRIELDCLQFLARHDPIAGDLRRVAAALKVNHELERMADEAVSIARRARTLCDLSPVVPIPRELGAMADAAMAMMRASLDAFVAADAGRARAVVARDDEVDRLHRRVIAALKGTMRGHPDAIDAGLPLYSAASHLERIADHATNIAEEAVYLTEGAIIRHRFDQAYGGRRLADRCRLARSRST